MDDTACTILMDRKGKPMGWVNLMLAALFVAGQAGDAAAQNYHAIQLDGTQPGAMSSCGNVTVAKKYGSGVVYHDGVYAKLKGGVSPVAPAKIAVPTGSAVNNYGDVAGSYGGLPCTTYCQTYPFVISNGKYRNLSFVPNSEVADINDSSVVVGLTRMYNPSTGQFDLSVPFIYDGNTTEIVPVVGMKFAGVNNIGQIVGTKDGQAFIYLNGGYTTIPVDPLDARLAINDAGDVAGTTGVPGVTSQGFIYSGGAVNLIGQGPAPFNNYNQLYALNNQRVAVGAMFPQQGVSHAMLYVNGTIIDLNDVSDAPEELTTATGISDGGEITALGRYPYVLVPNNGQFPPNTCKTH